MPNPDVEVSMLSVISAYPQAKTQQAKARLEERLWSLAPPETRKGVVRRDWLAATLGREQTGSLFALISRQSLLGAPQILWDRVNAGSMSLDAAARLWRYTKAELRRQVGADPVKLVVEALAIHDARPRRKNGTVRGSSKLTSRVAHEPLSRSSQVGTSSRAAWNRLRDVLGEIVDAKFIRKNVDATPARRAAVMTYIESEIDSVIQGVDHRIRFFVRGALEDAEITRRQVLDACKVLTMEPPSPGVEADLGLARRQKRRLAEAYHPDKVGDSLRDQYQAVIEAFSVLEIYNKQVAQK